MKSKFKITRADYLKAMRKARRDEEIREHLHPVNINRVHKSKKVYNRKRNKADLNKDLPYFILNPINFLIYDFRLSDFLPLANVFSIAPTSTTGSPSRQIRKPEVFKSPVSTHTLDSTFRLAKIPLRCNALRTIAYLCPCPTSRTWDEY